MNKPKNVFVILTADNCSACRNAKNSVIPQLKEKLSVKFDIVHIEKIKMSDEIPRQYNPVLKNLVQGYPSYFIFTADDWNNHSGLSKKYVKAGGDFNTIYKWAISSDPNQHEDIITGRSINVSSPKSRKPAPQSSTCHGQGLTHLIVH